MFLFNNFLRNVKHKEKYSEKYQCLNISKLTLNFRLGANFIDISLNIYEVELDKYIIKKR